MPWAALLNTSGAVTQSARIVLPLPEASAFVDRAQIEQVLINLCKNAVEAGSDTADVEIAVLDAGQQFLLQVRDHGTGMTDTVLEQALLPFYSTKRSGTGLGLALAREIAEAHGGRIRLSNRPEGGVDRVDLAPKPPRGWVRVATPVGGSPGSPIGGALDRARNGGG